MNDETMQVHYQITLAGYQALGPAPEPCGECDFCVCVEDDDAPR